MTEIISFPCWLLMLTLILFAAAGGVCGYIVGRDVKQLRGIDRLREYGHDTEKGNAECEASDEKGETVIAYYANPVRPREVLQKRPGTPNVHDSLNIIGEAVNGDEGKSGKAGNYGDAGDKGSAKNRGSARKRRK
jgi:hypothetical protein